MPVISKLGHHYLPVKYFLSSYRAFLDGRRAVALLADELEKEEILLSEWKIHWVAACTLLRSSIDLFQADTRVCVSPELRSAIKREWQLIGEDKEGHSIFWEFLREERNNILHEYKWSAYQRYLDNDGNPAKFQPTLITLSREFFTPELGSTPINYC